MEAFALWELSVSTLIYYAVQSQSQSVRTYTVYTHMLLHTLLFIEQF